MTSYKITGQKDDHLLSSYDYSLPEEFIALRPVSPRDQSKLLVYNAKNNSVTHSTFKNIGQFLPKSSVLVLNQSRVFPARLIGKKPTGGEVELFLLSLIQKENLYPVMLKCSGKKNVGDLYFFQKLTATLKKVDSDGGFWVSFNTDHLLNELELQGLIPIPPYIRNGIADEKDKTEYQTVYAGELGSVAAPTAGLHFTPELLQQFETAYVTLHVGVGTFKPVQKENILEHKMHKEFYSVDEKNAEVIAQNFDHLIAVGTTSLRTLQSCMEGGQFQKPKQGFHETDIFLYPGKEIHGMKGLITNFHLPKSSLLMLVSSLIGREKTLELYELAKKEQYRFFSYGDAMLILI
ncbi:MAG: tRNA preQ1(34) S-adenosylmethionine ribosyltransferase-isomerase QueA [Bacteriovoracaceae bacterium]